MTSVARESRAFKIVVPLLLAAATIGFWGDGVINPGAAPAVHTPRDEDWLAEPLPPTALDAKAQTLLSSAPLPAAAGAPANPFLTVAEGRHGGPWQPAAETQAGAGSAAPIVADGWPALRAVISLNGRESVLLDASSQLDARGRAAATLRVGDRLEGLEVLEIAGQHVLVKGEEGHKWLHLSAP